ncbi:MAG TPA: hypothetical protein VFZ91_05430 [Allosphingosinicella sp.]
MENSESRNAPSPEAASDDFASPIPLSPAEARAYWRGVADGMSRAGAAVPPKIAARAAAAPGKEAGPPAAPLPWETDPPEEESRQRHDAFTGAKKQAYLKTLAKAGCILDACRLTGISSTTVYNHQQSDPEFARNCRLALGMASTPIELTAYERAIVGQEEPVIRGGKVVGTRIRRSDYMLRVLLQGSNPKKYGPRPGFTRKRLLKFERKQIEREVMARNAATERSGEDAIQSILTKVENIERHRNRQRHAEGWTELGCGIWVPPDWVWAGEGDPRDAVARLEKKDDAVYDSSNLSTSPPNLPPGPTSP